MTSNGSFSQTVAKATATLSVTGSVPGTLYTGQAVSYTATVTGITPPGAGTPTGSIVFSVVGGGDTANCQGGNTQPLSGSSATCNIPGGLLTRPLSYTVTATLQDPNYKSPVAGSLVQLVTKAPTSTTVSGVPISVIASERFDVHVTIQTQAPAGRCSCRVTSNGRPATSTTPPSALREERTNCRLRPRVTSPTIRW